MTKTFSKKSKWYISFLKGLNKFKKFFATIDFP